MSKFIICLYVPSKFSGHVDEIARLLERRFSPPIVLLSNCEFPTRTQAEGIAFNQRAKIFCFNNGACQYLDKCIFGTRCKGKNFPKESIEKALESAAEWLISLSDTVQ